LKNSLTLPTIYVSVFFGFAALNITIPVIPLYATDLGASISEVGLITGVFSYVAAIFLLPCGMLSDRYGRRNFLIGSLVVAVIVPVLYPLATTPTQLIIIRAIHGLTGAALIPTANAAVVDLAPPEQRGKVLGWHTGFGQFGLMAGPTIGGYLLHNFGYNISFWGSSAVSLIGLILLLSQYRNLPHKQSPLPSTGSSWDWLKRKLILVAMLASMFLAFSGATIGAYIPLYIIGFGLTEINAGFIISAFYAGSASIRLLTGSLSDKFGRKPMIITGLIVCAAAIASVSQLHTLTPLIIVSLISGLGLGIAQPSAHATAADHAPPTSRGLAMSLTSGMFQVGSAVGMTAMGFIAEVSSFETMFISCGFIIFLSMFLIAGLMRTSKS